MDLSRLPLLHAGVDEAGVGPLAGPVIAAAVILDRTKPIAGLNDSKLLTAKKREQLAVLIKENALAWSIARAEVTEIDALNVLQARLLAMQRAIASLSIIPKLVLIDGNQAPKLAIAFKTIVEGDKLIPAISAASILAKVTRDAEMIAYDATYPEYEFAKHKGYATKLHRQLLRQHGASPIHRRSFLLVRQPRLFED